MKNVSIILPCYNEAESLLEKLDFLKKTLDQYKDYSFSYVVVDDGSKDNTKELSESVPFVKTISYLPNQGKGHAVRTGLKYALDNLNPDCLFFMDIDLSTDLSAVPTAIKELDNCPLVIGSRYDKGSNIVIKQPLKRRFISKCSRIIIKSMFHFKVKETQCGFKAMNKEVAKLFVEKGIIERFAFDVEYLYIAKLNNIPYKSIPVTWRDDRGSTVGIVKSSNRFFKDLFVIKKHKKEYILEK